MFPIIILALVASVTADVFVESQCPETKPVENFNFTSFGQGTWYEIGLYPNSAENMAECAREEYELQGDTFKVRNVHITNNKLVTVEGFAKFADNAGNSGKLLYTVRDGPFGSETKSIMDILAIDYKNYAIGYICKYDEAKKRRQDFVWVVSRTKTLDDTVMTTIENFIKESAILDFSKFIWPDFINVACEVDA